MQQHGCNVYMCRFVLTARSWRWPRGAFGHSNHKSAPVERCTWRLWRRPRDV